MRYSRSLCIGPGGIKCICCFPAPGSKDRKYQFRAAKKKDKRDAFKAEQINMEDGA